MIRLHDNLSSGNGYKARLLLAQLAISFERIEYDIDAGETRTPRFLEKANPNGRVPVLQTEDGRFLPESNVILCYLAEAILEAANIAPDVAVKAPCSSLPPSLQSPLPVVVTYRVPHTPVALILKV